MKKSIQILIMLAFISWNVGAQTNVGGTISTNTTWTLMGSPYIVAPAGIALVNHITLTIEPGVVVKFDANAGIATNGGTIIAEGTMIDSITFTSSSATPFVGIWRGIVENNWDSISSLASRFNYCNFRYAQQALYLENWSNDTTFISNSKFEYDSIGIYNRCHQSAWSLFPYYNLYLDSSFFRQNHTAFVELECNALITNSSFNNNITGLYFSFIENTAAGSIVDNCTINSNNKGIEFYSSYYCCIKNCVIDSNLETGVSFTGSSDDSIYNCEIKHNGIGINVQSFSGNNQIANNIFEYDSVGIYLTSLGNDFRYFANQFRYNTIGLSIEYTGNAFVTNNIFEYNSIAINLRQIYYTVLFSCNKICNNYLWNVKNRDDTLAYFEYNYWCTSDTSIISSTFNNTNGGIYFFPVDNSGCYIPGCILNERIDPYGSKCDTCHDGGAMMNVTNGFPPYTFSWNTSPIQTTQTAFGLIRGFYQCCATDAHGCTICGSVFVDTLDCHGLNYTYQVIDATCSTCNDGKIIFHVTGGTPWSSDGYNFDRNNSYTSDTIWTGMLPGTYIICVNDRIWCKFCDSVTIGVNTGINEITGNHGISIYPNPNDGTFTIRELGIRNYDFRITDVLGRTVYSQSFKDSKGKETITVPLSNGIYFWEVITNDGLQIHHSVLAKGKLIVINNSK